MSDFTKSAAENFDLLKSALRVNSSFDILTREVKIAGRAAHFFFIDGFVEEAMAEKLMQFFYSLKPENLENIDMFLENGMPYTEVEKADKVETVVTQFLSGVTVLVIDGYDECILIDCRTYPARSVTEPWKDRVLRGSRDGFVETLVYNTALIRRRIRSPEYRCEITQIGECSRTDVAICYIEGRADKEALNLIKDKLANAKIDALAMNQESLAECIYKGSWINPFPKFRYTERPDTVAASVINGQIAVLVDNSPAAMLLPTTVFDAIEEADDYYFSPLTGTYLRLARAFITIISILLTPLYLLYAVQPELLPNWLMFTKVSDELNIPIIWQLLMLEIGVDGLKLAAINTPNMLNTPLSLIAAIIIGEFTITTGWFVPQTLLYMAVVAIANFTHENYEFAYAIKFLRIILLILTAIFGLYGFIGGVIFTAVVIGMNKTITNTSYIYPLIPFDFKKFCRQFFRTSK